MSVKSSFGVLEDAGGSSLGSWHLNIDLDVVIGFWCFQVENLALYLDYEGAKNIHVC